MKTPPDDDRPASVIAYHWASRIMTVSLEMVLPGLAGYWLDQRVGIRPVFTVLGFGAGMVFGIWHLIQMTRSPDNSDRESGDGER